VRKAAEVRISLRLDSEVWESEEGREIGGYEMGCRGANVPPMVGSLFSWKSLFTKRITSED
jgi:hypothetical protein